MQYVSLISIVICGQLEPSLCRVLPSAVVRGRKNPLFFGLARRLQKARRAAHLSFDSVADLAGMTDGSSVAHLERKAGHVPRLDTVERIAYALHLSPGFLAYAIEGEASPPTKGLRCEGVAQRLADTRAARGLSMRALARLAGLTDTAVRSTESGLSVPSIATAEALAKALDLSPAWLAYGIGPRELPARRKARTASAAQSR